MKHIINYMMYGNDVNDPTNHNKKESEEDREEEERLVKKGCLTFLH